MAGRWLTAVLRYPKTVIVLTLLFVVGMAVNIRHLEIDPAIKSLLPADFPELLRLEEFEDMFAASEILLVAVDVDDFLAPETLSKLYNLQEELENQPEVERVHSLLKMKHLEARENSFRPRDILDVENLPETPVEQAALRELIRRDEMYIGSVISEDLQTLAFIVMPESGFDDRAMALSTVEIAHRSFGDDVVVTGLPPTRNAVMTGMQGDLKMFMPLGIVLMIMLLVASFRTWLGAILPLLVVIMSVLSTFGLMGLVGEKVRMVTVIMPVMLIAIANDYGIHLVAHYLGGARDHVGTRRELIYSVSRSLGVPIVAAGATTVLGFLTLTTHILPSARTAGLLSAFGVIIAFVMSLTFIPAMLVLLKPPPGVTDAFSVSLMSRLLARFCRFLRRHGRLTAAVIGLVGLAAALGLPDLNVDTDPVRYFHEKSDVRVANNKVNEVFGGSSQMNILTTGDIKEPETLRKMEAFGEYLETLPMVSRTQSLADIVKRMNRAFHNDDPAYDRIPDTRAAVAQYLLVYSFSADLSDFDQFVDFKYKNAQIAARVNSTSSSDIKALTADTNAYIAGSGTSDLFPVVTGFVTILGSLVDMVVYGQLVSLGVSLVLIFFVAAGLFRSAIGGLFISLPLAFAVLVVFGLMGHFGIELNIATAMLSSIVIGVGVDYVIHFLWHYREHLRTHGDPWRAVDETLMVSGRGIIVNALSVVIGFSVMLASNFLPIFFFGFLLTISITTCLIAAMVILPVLVTSLRPAFLLGGKEAQPSPAEMPPELSVAGSNRAVIFATRGLTLALAAGGAWFLWWAVEATIEWSAGLPGGVGFWLGLWELMVASPSIVIAIYTIACLNAAGVAEFKFGKPFTRAFLLALPLTPVVMIAAWARR